MKGINYYSKEINKLHGLEYADKKTEIVGDTFYIKVFHAKEKLFDVEYWHPIFILPMKIRAQKNNNMVQLCKMHLITILECLVDWNFDVKYKWIYEELQGELNG